MSGIVEEQDVTLFPALDELLNRRPYGFFVACRSVKVVMFLSAKP